MKQRQSTGNKATSQHPEAILKRERKKSPNHRRRHNFAERAQFLQEKENQNDEFDTSLDGLRENQLTNTNIHPVEDPTKGEAGGTMAQVHPLHSTAVDKLEVSLTSADDVVQVIKRAQNLHDVHDIREIAHFLLEDCGEYYFVPCKTRESVLMLLYFACIKLFTNQMPHLPLSLSLPCIYQTYPSPTATEAPSSPASPSPPST